MNPTAPAGNVLLSRQDYDTLIKTVQDFLHSPTRGFCAEQQAGTVARCGPERQPCVSCRARLALAKILDQEATR